MGNLCLFDSESSESQIYSINSDFDDEYVSCFLKLENESSKLFAGSNKGSIFNIEMNVTQAK